MTKVNIISGFLGAGKTTLIKKLLNGAFEGEKVVLLENEYGEVGIDGGFMKDSGIQVTEINSGCICCTLVGDFSDALVKMIDTYHPDRILIEPSGVGKLSDIRKVVSDVAEAHPELALAGLRDGCGREQMPYVRQEFRRVLPGSDSVRGDDHSRAARSLRRRSVSIRPSSCFASTMRAPES